MKHLRAAFIALAVLALLPLAALAFQTQRAQIGITIVINVTPNPLGYVQQGGATDMAGIIAKATLHGAPPAIERAFEAQQLHFTQVNTGQMVAQVQKSLRVEAEVTPNPTATLLTTDAPGSTVIVSAEAGVPTAFSCVYHVAIQTAVTSWTLKHGLATDFFNGAGTSFPGGSVANNTYIAAPHPTATPFLVYSTDGGIWANADVNTLSKTYCVDLTVSMPISTPQGTFSSNAIYTLYY